MSNELRDPHDPVIPGEHIHPPDGHGGVSMGIGASNPDFDPHEPVMPAGMAQDLVAHVESNPPTKQTPGIKAVETKALAT